MRALVLAALLLAPLAAAGIHDARTWGDLIVTLHDGEAAIAGFPLLAVVPAFVLQDATLADAVRWQNDPRVERVDWARPLEFHGTPALPTNAFTGLTRADADGLTGAGVTLAVLDSGIDATHPDLAGRVKTNVRLVDKRFIESAGDTDGHGTHVAGLVAASSASSDGRWQGVAPAASLVGIDISGRFTTSSALLAYDWLLANHARLDIRVVVNAWGRVGEGETFDARDPEIRAIDRLIAAGVVVLFSASNHGPGPGTLSLEAMDPHVITVGATNAAGQLMDYSSRGPVSVENPWMKPDVVAPGDAAVGPRSGQIAPRADDPDPLHTMYSGTSQAVPHVAGIVAQMLQAYPGLQPADIATALRASAIDLDTPGPDERTGYGLVDAHDALRVAAGLTAGRGNVLITGGTEQTSDSADLRATGRRSILDLVTLPPIVWETPFVVKVGTERVRVDAQVQGAQSLSIELIQGGRVLKTSEVDAPEPGIWMLRLRATLPFTTSAHATFDSLLPPQPNRALEADGRIHAPAIPPTVDDWAGVPKPLWIPLGMWGAAGAVLAYAIMPSRKREE